jgi:hypothetical protein
VRSEKCQETIVRACMMEEVLTEPIVPWRLHSLGRQPITLPEIKGSPRSIDSKTQDKQDHENNKEGVEQSSRNVSRYAIAAAPPHSRPARRIARQFPEFAFGYPWRPDSFSPTRREQEYFGASEPSPLDGVLSLAQRGGIDRAATGGQTKIISEVLT